MKLTIAYITARHHPKIEWFIDSLLPQVQGDWPEIICVDLHYGTPGRHPDAKLPKEFKHVPPKPNVWNGDHRLTKDQWWSASSNRNTALCLARGDYIIWVDDRCVLSPTWLRAAQEAMSGNYAVCGTYEKRHGMKVEGGIITDAGTLNSEDGRKAQSRGQICRAPGQWYFGGTLVCPSNGH